MSMRRRPWSRILPFLGITLFLHQVAIVGVWIHYRLHPPKPLTELADAEDVTLDWIEADDSLDGSLSAEGPGASASQSAADKAAQAAEDEAEKKRKAEEEKNTPPGQVVEMAPPKEEKVPAKAKFASEYNTSVEREMQARGRGDIKAAPGPIGPVGGRAPGGQTGAGQPSSPAVPPMAMAPNTAPSMEGRPVPPSPLSTGPGEMDPMAPDPDGLAPPTPDMGHAADERPPSGAEGLPLPSGGARHPPSLAQLMPSDRDIAQSLGGGGGGGSIDYLTDVEEGETTALSSKRWKFASFFNRVKRTVAEHWNPSDEYRRNDPTGNIYGMRDRVTVLRVSLKPDGSLGNVLVEQASGVAFLDDVALEAFRSAQPFPNPPRALVDQTGQIQFRFAFIFEISSTPSFKVFRYN